MVEIGFTGIRTLLVRDSLFQLQLEKVETQMITMECLAALLL